MEKIYEKKWSRYALLALAIAAFLGILLRYKIAFSLPFVDQANLLHAHSHFVMQAWVSLGLAIALVAFLLPVSHQSFRNYYLLMFLIGIGMIISFSLDGYSTLSIILSTLSLFVFYAFSISFWRALRYSTNHKIVNWLAKSAVFFYFLASVGTLIMAYLMVNRLLTPYLLKFCTYWFLHFQYNGWFTFAVLALSLNWLLKKGIFISDKAIQAYFWMMIIATTLGFVLSILAYQEKASYLFYVGDIAMICQVVAQIIMATVLLKHREVIYENISKPVRLLWTLSILAFMLKTLLQCMSLIPSMVEFAATFRPIIIGYLHLAFLVMVSFFMIGLFIEEGFYDITTTAQKWGLYLFVIGVLLNEFLLMTQGLSFIAYSLISFMGELLLAVTAMMFLGIAIFYGAQKRLQ